MKRNLKNPNLQPFEKSADVTEFRRLAHRLRYNAINKNQKVVMITSATMGEGKSTVSSFLAIALAHYQQTLTLLVDCDLRRSRINKIFDVNLKNGLAEYFERKISYNQSTKYTAIPKLKIITAGDSNGTTQDFLESSLLHQFIEVCRSRFDMIILDCPPVIPVSAPYYIANFADAICWVVKAGHTNKKLAKHAIEILSENKKKIVGCVINNSSNIMPYYYDYFYYAKKYEKK